MILLGCETISLAIKFNSEQQDRPSQTRSEQAIRCIVPTRATRFDESIVDETIHACVCDACQRARTENEWNVFVRTMRAMHACMKFIV